MTTRLVTWLMDERPSGEREVIAYAAGSVVGIAVAAVVLTFVAGFGVLGT